MKKIGVYMNMLSNIHTLYIREIKWFYLSLDIYLLLCCAFSVVDNL